MATINGVETNDNVLNGTDGNDTIFGGMGDETLDGKSGSDLMDASGGKNILTGGTGADYFCVGAGDDTITDYATEDWIFAEERGSGETRNIAGVALSGSDVVISVSDVWTHGSSNNMVTVQDAANKKITFMRVDYYKDNKGKEVREFGGYTMTQTALALLGNFGGSAHQKDWGSSAWRTLDARKYLPTITTINGSAATKATILYGNGNANAITGGSANDSLYGLDGNDTLRGGKGVDYLDGGVGDDVLYGGTGKDTFVYKTGTGKDTIGDYAAGDLLSITGGAVSRAAVSGSNVVFTVGSGTVTLNGAASKTISMKDSRGSYTMSKTGLTLSSNFTGTMGAAQYLSTVKTINGKSAKKTIKLYGNAQANTIAGGKAADYLDGGASNDTLTGGAGNDTFAYKASTGKDVITDYATGDLFYVTSGTISKTALANKNKDLVFTVGKGTVTMKNAAAKSSVKLKDSRGNYTMTKSGLSLSSNFKGALNSAYYLATITSINGSSTTNAVTLYGNAKNNTINGGKVADKLYGRAGNDKILGNAGNDYLYGEAGSDNLNGGAGADYLYGGAGNDILTGGAGNDTFAFAKSTGKDVVTDYNKSGTDTLYISSGSISKVALSGSNMVFTVGSGTITLNGAAAKTITVKDSRGTYAMSKSTLTLTNTFTGSLSAANYLSSLTTIDGTKATKAVNLTGNAKNNTIKGGSVNDKLYGGAGNDKLYGNAGKDSLDGGAGKDYLYGGAGDDTLLGGADNDVLYGGAGNNTLQGGAGSDIFQYGGGNDVIKDYEVGKDTIRLNSYTLSSAKASGKNVILKLTNGKTITVNGMANKKITIVDSKGKSRVLQIGTSNTQQNIIKKFMKSLDNATTKSGLAALNAAVLYASGGLCLDWNTLVNNFVADVAKYGGKAGGDGTEYDYDLKKWLPDASTHAFLKKYCGIDLKNNDTGALTGKDAGGKSIKTAETIVNEGNGFGNSVSWYTVLNLNGVTFHLPSTQVLVNTVSNNPNIDLDSAKWITGALYEKWLPAALKLVETTYGLSYNETDVPRSSRTVEVRFDYQNANWTARANDTSLTINMYYWNGINILTGESSGSYGEKVDSSYYFDRTLAHELTHAVMCANLNHDLWQSLFYNFGCVLEGTAELVHGIDDERLSGITKLVQSSNATVLKKALTGGYSKSGSINSNAYAGGYMLFRYLAKQVAEGRSFNAISASAAGCAPVTMNSPSPLLADSSAMLVGSADAQLSSLVSTTTSGNVGSMATPGTGLASVDASGGSLAAATGVDTNNPLTNKNKVA